MTEIIEPIRSDALDYEDIISRIKGIYNSCNPLEQKQLLKILEELGDKGYSQTLEQIYLVDFKEVPVSIDRFLCDPEYLGETNDCGKQIYPGWWEVYHNVFDSQKDIYEVLLSGATRIGKTSTAVSMMAYMTYLLMCYRNPQRYFGLKEVSRATIAFANLTKELALSVAFREYNDTLLLSPWFCLHKDTQILTSLGYMSIADAVGISNLAVATLTPTGKIDYVIPEGIMETKRTTHLIELELEDGTVLRGTPDHLIMLSDGTYKELQYITETDDIMTVSKEYFVPLANYIGIYEISNLGNIRNCRRGQVLKPRIRKHGYLAFDLVRDGKMTTECLPMLMISTFMPEYTGQMFYLKDGNRFNNALSNIAIGRRYLGDSWRDVPNTAGMIQVNNLGQVYAHTMLRVRHSRKTVVPEHFLHINLDADGYAYVDSIEFPNIHFVHRLVAEAFIPNPENKHTVNHIDANKLNNSVHNLEWATNQEQTNHAVAMGLISKHPGCKGTPIKEITTNIIFTSRFDAARYFSISEGTVKRSIRLGTYTLNGLRFIQI